MSTLLIVAIVLVVLLALGILGAVIEGILWLALIGAIAIVAAAVFGWFRVRGRLGGSRSSAP